jgi:hypothetical protein
MFTGVQVALALHKAQYNYLQQTSLVSIFLNRAPRVHLYALNKLRDRALHPTTSLWRWTGALQSSQMPGDLYLLPQTFGKLACNNTVPRFSNNLEYMQKLHT